MFCLKGCVLGVVSGFGFLLWRALWVTVARATEANQLVLQMVVVKAVAGGDVVVKARAIADRLTNRRSGMVSAPAMRP
jgi:hypothetical protein